MAVVEVAGAESPVTHVVTPPPRDLGDFQVRRAIPTIECRAVGPFVFLDHMGPVAFLAGGGIDVRPHPHIGLATVTYLLAGEMEHKDSEGHVQTILPGEVNWMTAGRGIVHSERTPKPLRETGFNMYGLQLWAALPRSHEEVAPSFAHHGGAALPYLSGPDSMIRVVTGHLLGKRSPVVTFGDTLLADISLAPGASLEIPAESEERALYLLDGAVTIAGRSYDPAHLLVLKPDVPVVVSTEQEARLVLLGGDRLDGPRHLNWNFVSSSSERISQARADWKAGRFKGVPGDPEFIPLPE